MASIDKDKHDEQINTLKALPQVKEVRALIHRLEKELEKLTAKEIPVTKPSNEEIKAKANARRSSRGKNYWRYVKLIRDNFPNISIAEIRRQYSQRRRGFDTDIPHPEYLCQNLVGNIHKDDEVLTQIFRMRYGRIPRLNRLQKALKSTHERTSG